MAYPTQTIDRTVEDIDRLAANIKQFAIRRKSDMATGSVGATTIFDVAINVRDARNRLSAMAAVPSIAARTAALKGVAEASIVADFNAMLAAMDNIVSWVAANFPKDANGFLLSQTLGADGPIDRQFTTAQTAAMRTQLDSLIAAID